MASAATDLHTALSDLHAVFAALRPLIDKKPTYETALAVDALVAKIDLIPQLPEVADARGTLHLLLLSLAAKVRAAKGGTAREIQRTSTVFTASVARFRDDYSELARQAQNAPDLWK